MIMSEQNFWVLLRKNLPLKLYRVENKVSRGMPDVHFASKEKLGMSGWVELKYLPEFPKRQMTVGLKKHQAMWLKEYSNYGQSWLLVRIGSNWTGLFFGSIAEEIFARPTKEKFCSLATWSKRGNLTKDDWKRLSEVMCLGCEFG
jgi:hypothetical protein